MAANDLAKLFRSLVARGEDRTCAQRFILQLLVTVVSDSFPWPQSPTHKQIEAVAKEAVALRQLRREVMAKMDWSLRDLYRTLEEPGSPPLRRRPSQTRCRRPRRLCYTKDADILAFLLALNQPCAAKEAAGESITPPGLPLPVKEHGNFITEDCIRV